MWQLICCCTRCKPRHLQLCDAIYPRNELETRANNNVDKLVFYACSHGEKLSRIGNYLVTKLSRDLSRQKIPKVRVATDALIRILKSSHHHNSQSSFIDSYLLMVQKLLETNDRQMEDLAINCYVIFAQIDEVQPNYSRCYDFFIPKFVSLCFANRGDFIKQQRSNGLTGLLALVWRATSGDYQSDFWSKDHMEKVIPAILVNIKEDGEETATDNLKNSITSLANQENTEPHLIAAECLREIMGKSSYESFQCVLEPLIIYCDDHKHWLYPTSFAIHVFKVVVFSIPGTSSIIVIESLLKHMDKYKNTNVHERIGIAKVLYNIGPIAGQSIGPLLLSTYNDMLKNLKTSVEFQESGKCNDVENEKVYQETFTHAIGNFCSILPDYQKLEIMIFTTGEICRNQENDTLTTAESFYHHVLASTFLKIATKYQTSYLSTLFTDNFTNTMLRLAIHPNADIRLIIQRVFHTLLDRKNNLKQLEHVPLIDEISDINIKVEKCSKADQMFARRFISQVSAVMYKVINMVDDNGEIMLSVHIDSILCTMCLFCIEVGCDETIVEMIHLCASYQTLALNEEMNEVKKKFIHQLCERFFNLISLVTFIPTFHQHVKQVLNYRQQNALILDINKNNPESFFDLSIIIDALKSSGKDVSRFNVCLGGTDSGRGDSKSEANNYFRKQSTASVGESKFLKPSDVDYNVSFDISVDWSPVGSECASRRNTIIEDNAIDTPALTAITSLRQIMKSVNSTTDVNDEIMRDKARSADLLQAFRRTEIDDISHALLKDTVGSDFTSRIKSIIERNDGVEDSCYKSKAKNVFDIAIPESFIF
uniref:Serine/threonine-protein kinase TOR n=1 Tax=Rhabditophanes sp. KR3021 TaxID=114890 RepID=A0AC35TLN6_9BILA